jgi:hypothetical protein
MTYRVAQAFRMEMCRREGVESLNADFMSRLQRSGPFGDAYLGLRPRLVYVALSALGLGCLSELGD